MSNIRLKPLDHLPEIGERIHVVRDPSDPNPPREPATIISMKECQGKNPSLWTSKQGKSLLTKEADEYQPDDRIRAYQYESDGFATFCIMYFPREDQYNTNVSQEC